MTGSCQRMSWGVAVLLAAGWGAGAPAAEGPAAEPAPPTEEALEPSPPGEEAGPLPHRLGEEGLVVLEVEVLPSGRAGRMRALEGRDVPRLVEAAKAAVRDARFRPALENGRRVRATVEIPFRFELR